MKAIFTLLLVSVLPLPLLAQNAPSKKPQTSHAKHLTQAKVAAVHSTPTPAVLTPDELALAERVYVGHLPCELGASVTVEADSQAPGYFHLQLGKLKFHMAPVATTTGAIRLEDRHAGAVWLQLANKSMMVSDKLGKRLVDACMNPAQVAVAQAMEKNPAPSVLDAATPPALNNAVALSETAK